MLTRFTPERDWPGREPARDFDDINTTAIISLIAVVIVAAVIIGGAVMLMLASPASAEVIPGERIIVIDGDTVALPCVQPGRGCAERVRLYSIDAPEIRGAACEAEHIAALEAKAALRALLTGPVEVSRCEPDTRRCKDRYRRTLGALRTAGGDIGQLMLASGNALPWRPGPAAKFQRQQHWCGR